MNRRSRNFVTWVAGEALEEHRNGNWRGQYRKVD